MEITRSVFRYIEHELYNYEQTRKELEFYREQVLEGTKVPEVSVQKAPSDTTASKAMQLTSSAFVAQAERVVRAVDRALEMLTTSHRELFNLKYKDCEQWPDITIYMGISDRTYYRMRRELVITVGQQLGLINIE